SPAEDASAPCLADRLASIDHRHPLLEFKTQAAQSRAPAAQADLQGFHLVRCAGKLFAVANALRTTDPSQLDAETLRDLHDDGLCVAARSIGEVWRKLSEVLDGAPRLVEEFRGFN